jgi:hypothetical protein
MLQQTILTASFETSCHSRIVDLRFQALAEATPRGSLAAFLWPIAGFQGGFAVALLAGGNDHVQVSRYIVNQALDRSKRDTAHGTLFSSSEGFVLP